MDKIVIDLVKLRRLKLSISEYLKLLSIVLLEQGKNINYDGDEGDLTQLDDLGYIHWDQIEGVKLLDKGRAIFPKDEKDDINFDELFELYPKKTPDGRVLRTDKERAGSITSGYKMCKRKYLLRVKNVDLHNEIVKATRAGLKHESAGGRLNYLNGLQPYINGQLWEKYFDLSEDSSDQPNNVRKL